MPDRLVTIFGGSGFIGRHLVNRLAREGWRIRVASRDVEGSKFLKPLGKLGQVATVAASVADADSVRHACFGAHMVVNLVGILYERGGNTFKTAHVTGASLIAQSAKDAGAEALIHVSALGAAHDSPATYARSKAEGEQAVATVFPEATILRPSVVFGPEDDFYNRFASMTRWAPFLPYFKAPPSEHGLKLQPVYVKDVCETIARVLLDTSLRGRTYELAGPEVYSMRQILEQTLRETRRTQRLVALPMAAAKVMATVLQFLPHPPLTPDMVALMKHDNVFSGKFPGFHDLGLHPQTVAAILPTYLDQYRPTHRQIRRIDGKLP